MKPANLIFIQSDNHNRHGDGRCRIKLTDIYRMSIARGFADAATLIACLAKKAATLHMGCIPDRSTCALNIALMALVLALTAACSPGPVWSTAELENSRHFFLSLEASQKATQLTNKGDPDVSQFGIEEINKYQKAALGEARLVLDSVLEKAHPELKEHFRSEYQRGLDSILASYAVGVSAASGAPSSGQIDLQVTGVRLLRQWNDWLNAHNHEIHMPDQPAAKSK